MNGFMRKDGKDDTNTFLRFFIPRIMGIDLSKNFFQLKSKHVLFEKPKQMPPPGPYYPCLVSMKAIGGFPFEYALFFSTDHHRKNGGIWLYLCNGIPTDPKNWKS